MIPFSPNLLCLTLKSKQFIINKCWFEGRHWVNTLYPLVGKTPCLLFPTMTPSWVLGITGRCDHIRGLAVSGTISISKSCYLCRRSHFLRSQEDGWPGARPTLWAGFCVLNSRRKRRSDATTATWVLYRVKITFVNKKTSRIVGRIRRIVRCAAIVVTFFRRNLAATMFSGILSWGAAS